MHQSKLTNQNTFDGIEEDSFLLYNYEDEDLQSDVKTCNKILTVSSSYATKFTPTNGENDRIVKTKSNMNKNQNSFFDSESNIHLQLPKYEEEMKRVQAIGLKRFQQMKSRMNILVKEMEDLREENNHLLQKERYLLVQRRIIDHMWMKIQRYSVVTESMQETLIDFQLQEAESKAKLHHSMSKLRHLEEENSDLDFKQNRALSQISILEKEKKEREENHLSVFVNNTNKIFTLNQDYEHSNFHEKKPFHTSPSQHIPKSHAKGYFTVNPSNKQKQNSIAEREKINHKIHETIQCKFRLSERQEN